MLRDVPRSTATIFYGLLSAAFLGIASCNAAPVNCPAEVLNLKPAPGDLFVASSVNPVQRIRANGGEVRQPIVLKPDANISFYYFVNPKALDTPMVFALIRAYKIRKGHSTSLEPDEVFVSNSLSRHRPVSTEDYVFFHDEKRYGPNILRTKFHMKFHDVFYSLDNSYDDVRDPDIYALPKGNGFSGFKARMQRITGFTEDGRCVVFTLFRHKRFAEALDSFSLSLIALADERKLPDDIVRFSIGFPASP